MRSYSWVSASAGCSSSPESSSPIALSVAGFRPLRWRDWSAVFRNGGPERVVLIAPAVKGEWFLDVFQAQVDLSEKALVRFRQRFRAFAGTYLMRVLGGEGDVADADILILHDPDDDRTPYADAAAYASNRTATRLVDVVGSGHKGILSDPTTLAETIAFIDHSAEAQLRRALADGGSQISPRVLRHP